MRVLRLSVVENSVYRVARGVDCFTRIADFGNVIHDALEQQLSDMVERLKNGFQNTALVIFHDADYGTFLRMPHSTFSF